MEVVLVPSKCEQDVLTGARRLVALGAYVGAQG